MTQTRAIGSRPAGTNDLVFEFIESPEDASEKVFELRRFVMPVQFTNKSQVSIVGPSPSDFKLVSRMDLDLRP